MNTYFYLSRKRKNSENECPVYCRVSHLQERADFSTGIFIAPDNWGNGLPIKNTRECTNRLTNISNAIYNCIAQCERDGNFCPGAVIELYHSLGKAVGKNRIVNVALELLQIESPGKGSRDKIVIASEQFVLSTGTVEINKVVPETIKGFCNVMREGTRLPYKGKIKLQKFRQVTIHKKLEFLKRVFVFAKNKGYIKSNPFDFVKIPRGPRSAMVQMTAAEIKKLQGHLFASNRLNQVKDLILFQCFTGLSYSDLVGFNRGNIVERNAVQFLSGRRAKPPHEEYFLPWLPEARSIADKYDYYLPVITNQKYNCYLKEIAEIVGIDKVLTTKVGRKTFGQNMIDKTYSNEAVAKMMGHVDFKMTREHYARVGERRIVEETSKLHKAS